jgi:hypothetical protein
MGNQQLQEGTVGQTERLAKIKKSQVNKNALQTTSGKNKYVGLLGTASAFMILV